MNQKWCYSLSNDELIHGLPVGQWRAAVVGSNDCTGSVWSICNCKCIELTEVGFSLNEYNQLILKALITGKVSGEPSWCVRGGGTHNELVHSFYCLGFNICVMLWKIIPGQCVFVCVSLSCDNRPFPPQTCHRMKSTVVNNDSLVLFKTMSGP